LASGKIGAASHSYKLVAALLAFAVVTAFFAVVKPF
jgi:hypothetical protein